MRGMSVTARGGVYSQTISLKILNMPLVGQTFLTFSPAGTTTKMQEKGAHSIWFVYSSVCSLSVCAFAIQRLLHKECRTHPVSPRPNEICDRRSVPWCPGPRAERGKSAAARCACSYMLRNGKHPTDWSSVRPIRKYMFCA